MRSRDSNTLASSSAYSALDVSSAFSVGDLAIDWYKPGIPGDPVTPGDDFPGGDPASGASTAMRRTQSAGSGERHRPPAIRFVPAVGVALRTQPATLQGMRPSTVIVTPVFEVGVPASTEHGIAVG